MHQKVEIGSVHQEGSFRVERCGLKQLDYMFGCDLGDWYTWKEVTFGMGARHYIDGVIFTFNIEKSCLKLSARHEIDLH